MTEEYEALCSCPGHAGEDEHHIPCSRQPAPEALLCPACERGQPLCWNRACHAAEGHPHAQQEACLRDLASAEALL